MNLVELLISEKIAKNQFHAANMLNVLHCGNLTDDEMRVARCRLYHAWKMCGENKTMARENAIAGKAAPGQLFLQGNLSAEKEAR